MATDFPLLLFGFMFLLFHSSVYQSLESDIWTIKESLCVPSRHLDQWWEQFNTAITPLITKELLWLQTEATMGRMVSAVMQYLQQMIYWLVHITDLPWACSSHYFIWVVYEQ